MNGPVFRIQDSNHRKTPPQTDAWQRNYQVVFCDVFHALEIIKIVDNVYKLFGLTASFIEN